MGSDCPSSLCVFPALPFTADSRSQDAGILKDLFTLHSPLALGSYLCLPSPQLWASELMRVHRVEGEPRMDRDREVERTCEYMVPGIGLDSMLQFPGSTMVNGAPKEPGIWGEPAQLA